MTLIDTRL